MNKSRKHYIKCKQRAIVHLGGVCVVCGTNDNLQFDHIDPNKKLYTVSTKISHAWNKILPELNKCQLLCILCHKEKTKLEYNCRVEYVKLTCKVCDIEWDRTKHYANWCARQGFVNHYCSRDCRNNRQSP